MLIRLIPWEPDDDSTGEREPRESRLLTRKCSLKYDRGQRKHVPLSLCNSYSSLLMAEQEDGQYSGCFAHGTFFLISPNLRFNFFQCSFSSPLQF